jgi:hypothetical protein
MNIYREGEKKAFSFPQSKCLRGFLEIEHMKIEGSGLLEGIPRGGENHGFMKRSG